MPTIIALDVSYSMQRPIPGRSDDNMLTYHQLALKGISHFLEYLASGSKLEYISLVTYSSACEIRVDFTRDYDTVRQALKKIEAGDKMCLITMLKSVSSILTTNWGTQNKCQVVVFTDCGLGFGSTALKAFLLNYKDANRDLQQSWVVPLKPVKLNFLCMGIHTDYYFNRAIAMYQQLFDVSGLKGQLYLTKAVTEAMELKAETKENGKGSYNNNISNSSLLAAYLTHKSELGRKAMLEMVDRMCEGNYKPYEVLLKCGGYFRLETPVYLWPPPTPYEVERNGVVMAHMISPKLEVCGYLALSEIGSPSSISRHLIIPKVERDKSAPSGSATSSTSSRRSTDKSQPGGSKKNPSPHQEFEKLEQEIRDFYTKDSGDDSSDDVIEVGSTTTSKAGDPHKESLCVLLHGALKVDNTAALVLLNDNWYGYIYAYADSKKKSNLMLNILPYGNNIIPWLGDLQMLGMAEDVMAGENCSFPVKAEKRSYSQSCVVWIRHVSLQSDIQKVLRHAKKMPEKTQHFYKELNRIRRAALSIGFVELLEGMATLFDKESALLVGGNPECSLQLKHAAVELRKPSNRDLKVSIGPVQKFTPDGNAAVGGPAPPGFVY